MAAIAGLQLHLGVAFAAGAQCAIGQFAGAFVGFLVRVEDAGRGALQLAGRALEHALHGLVGPQQPALAQGRLAATANQLQRLGEEFDFTDAARPALLLVLALCSAVLFMLFFRESDKEITAIEVVDGDTALTQGEVK